MADGRSHVQQVDSASSRPVSIALDKTGPALYVADPDRRRVVALDRENGAFMGQVVAADNPDFAFLHAVVERDGQLLMLAGPRLLQLRTVGVGNRNAEFDRHAAGLGAVDWDGPGNRASAGLATQRSAFG